ncbi:unnamed protein product [Rangifer tarandus platyrhynchus]|uniref:Uncharacterized protein n=2 Tax=Rangifer tarandus platyrhynchus TaxID=3082113 RepID=A0ABN8YZS4_RANTA|nr:unnamed protein product [Rangifer tarandus platyrhynchus]
MLSILKIFFLKDTVLVHTSTTVSCQQCSYVAENQKSDVNSCLHLPVSDAKGPHIQSRGSWSRGLGHASIPDPSPELQRFFFQFWYRYCDLPHLQHLSAGQNCCLKKFLEIGIQL